MLLNILITAITTLFVWANQFTPTSQAKAPKTLPGAAAPTARPPSHLLFITYPDETPNGSAFSLATTSTTLALPFNPLTHVLDLAHPLTLNSQNSPATCMIDQVNLSPDSQHLILQTLCHADYFARLAPLTHSPADAITLSRGYFLNWSPDGGWFLFRNADTHHIYLIEAATHCLLPFVTQ